MRNGPIISSAYGPGRGPSAQERPAARRIDLVLCLPGEVPPGALRSNDPRRGRLAPYLAALARLVARRTRPHSATLRAYVLALRGCGESCEVLGGLFRTTARAVREWCEPGARSAPAAWRVVRRIRAHARRLAGLEGPMPDALPFPPDSVAGLLELGVRALEAKRRETEPAFKAGPVDVADQAEQLWPSCRGLLASKSRTSVLGVVRQAVMSVLAERDWPQDAIGDVVGRSRSTVAYHTGGE